MVQGIYGQRKWYSFSGQTTLGVADALAPIGVLDEDDTISIHAIPTFTESATFSFGTGEALSINVADSSTGAVAPLVMTTVVSGAGCTGARALFNTQCNVAAGGWINAIKGYMEFTGTSGRTTGLASAVCNELKLPNSTLASGQYYPVEIEVTAQASTVLAGTTGAGGGYIYAKINGTTTDWEDKAGFFWLDGLTAGSGNLLSANSQTVRCFVTSSMTAKYVMLSGAENYLSLTGSTTGIALGTHTTGITIENSTTAISFGKGDGSIVDAASSLTVYGGDTTGDALVLQASGADATQKVTITGASGTTIGGNLAIASTGTFTTGTGAISVLGDATWGTDKKAYFRDAGTYIYSSADGKIDIVIDTGGVIFTLGSSAYDKIQFGGGAGDWGSGAAGCLIDGTGYDWCTSTIAYATSGALATSCAAAYHAFTVNAGTHSTTSSFFGTWTELYIVASEDLTGASNAAAVWGQVECGASVTGPDQADGDFMAAGYFNFIAGDNFTTGSYVNGVRIQSEISVTGYTETASTWSAGLEILKKSGKQDWTYGVKVSNSATGLDIGTATTGINLSGTVTTGIDFTSTTITPDASRTNSAIAIGDRLGEKTVNLAFAASQHFDPIQMNINLTASGGAPTTTSTVNGIYQLITHDTVDMDNLRLKGCDWTITTDKTCQDAYVVQTELIISGDKVSGGELMAMSALTTLGTGARTADRVCALQAMITGSGTAGTVVGDCIVAYIVNAGTVVTTADIIRVFNQTAATAVNGIHINNDGSGTMTSLLKFTTGASSTTTNLIEIDDNATALVASGGAGAVGGNPVKIKINVDGGTKYLICADDWT